MAKQTIYTVGGTVQAGGGVYIKRKADDELLELCRQGEFAFILSSRQVGKSSLMVRTAQQLEKENICSVTIDLSAIGVNVSQDEWYLGILNEIQSTLNLETDIFSWWEQYAQLGPAQRLTNFFRDVLLKEVKEQIVLFFDEIDSTLSIPFSDDFYVALRAVYNARSTAPDFKRLSFVLVGVAAPGDLISDNKRTPFNIGHRVEINDFTLAEALPLAEGLGERAVQILTWVFQYTSGHPYLTQRLCAHLATLRESVDEAVVASSVERLFTGEQGKQDNNLQFVRDMLSKRSPDVTRVLLIYRDIRSGKRVADDERSIAKAHLKLSGLVRSEQGILRVRNEIYNTVFNPHWVQDTIPKNWQKIALISLSAILGILILGTLGVFVNDYFVGSRIDKHFRNFISAGSPRQRLADLAEIYRQQGILSNRDSELTASQLFYGLSTAEDQLALFRMYGPPPNPADQLALESDLVVVIGNLYLTVANVDEEEDNTELLQAMLNAISHITDDPDALRIKEEITAWIEARRSYSARDYEPALEHYNTALTKDPDHHAMLYERAKVYVALEQYENALSDLDAAIRAAKQVAPDSGTPTPTASPAPVSSTPDATTAQATQAASTSLASTRPATENAVTPTATETSAGEPTSTPTQAPTAVYTLPPKYESNFTTLIDIINAVQAVIRSSSQLQLAMQSSTNGEYTNLQSSGLINSTQVAPTGLLADIQERGYILVASDPNHEPQSFLNTEGQRPSDTQCPADALTPAEMQGFDVDMAIALGDALGVETCFATPSWDEVTAGSWSDRWDISIGSMAVSGSRQQVLDFSVPYYYTAYVIAVHSGSGITSLADLEGQALCVGPLTLEEIWLTGGDLDLSASAIYATPPPNITVVGRDNVQQCAQGLDAAQTQQQSVAEFIGYVAPESLVDENIAEGLPVMKLGSPVFAQELAAAFDKASSLPTDSLRAEVNRLFTTMQADGRLAELSNKWFSKDPTAALPTLALPTFQILPTATVVSGALPTFSFNSTPLAGFTPIVSPLPASSSEFVEYIVQEGDNLALIARRCNTTIEALIEANNLVNPNTITVGQTLEIPVDPQLVSSSCSPALYPVTPTP